MIKTVSIMRSRRVRFIGDPILFRFTFDSDRQRQIITDAEYDECMLAGVKVLTRYACLAIIRRYNNFVDEMVVLEFPIAIAKKIAAIVSNEFIVNSIGGENGYDLFIEKDGAGIFTKYDVQVVEQSPLTDLEKAFIRENPVDLLKKYAPNNSIDKKKEALRKHVVRLIQNCDTLMSLVKVNNA